LSSGDTLTLWYTGFDPQFAHLHAGTVLTYMLLERLFTDQRFKIYDFGFALVYAHAGLFAVSDSLKRVLDIFGARARMRQWMHARLY